MFALSEQVIAIAGASDLAKYLIEELLAASASAAVAPPKIAVLTRSLSSRPWFTSNPHISLHVTDYTSSSVQSILDSVGGGATVLFSFLHSNDPSQYNTAQEAMLDACRASKRCRRFIPSEYGGDIEKFPGLPRFYAPTHQAFRDRILSRETEIEWTVVNQGWFMDYFVQGSKVDPTILPYQPPKATVDDIARQNNIKMNVDFSIPRSYMKPLPGIWPLDLDTFTATRLGTGNELISWTSARDVARALVRLVQAAPGTWEKHTYVCGERGTWNQAIATMEVFFGRKFNIVEKPLQEIQDSLKREVTEDSELWQSYMDEWNVIGASAVPMQEVERDRKKFFADLEFRGIVELLRVGFGGEAGMV